MTLLTQKRLLWLLATASGIILIIFGLQGLATLYKLTKSAREVDSALNLITPRRTEPGLLLWLPDNVDQPRQLESFVRDQISRDYRLAYEELTYSLLTGEAEGLSSYFRGAALEDARLAASGKNRAKFIDWDHRLKLHFYSPDGATVAFTDHYRYAQGNLVDQDLEDVRIARRKVDVVAVLEEGRWRMHHWRVTADEREAATEVPLEGLPQRIAEVRGVNYIARNAPFDAFWPDFDEAEIAKDFSLIAKLGFNTVRFFVPFPEPEGLEQLPTLLELADEAGLSVVPTLLDRYTRYRLEDLPEVRSYLSALSRHLSHPSVLLIDVKNEADLDFKMAGTNRTRHFLGHVLQVVRGTTGKPVTVGLIHPDPILAEQMDVISLHHFYEASTLQERLLEANSYEKPVLLEEFGFHTLTTKLPDPHNEQEQAWYYQEIVRTAGANGVGWLAWTLFDLPTGEVPNGREVERHLGLLRADGSAKPAVTVVQGLEVEAPDWRDRFVKIRPLVFTRGALASLILFVITISWWLRRRTNSRRDRSH